MKKGFIILLLCFSMALSVTACGKKISENGDKNNLAETEMTEDVETEVTDSTETETEKKSVSLMDMEIPDSEVWPDYKKTMEYYVEKDLISKRMALLLNQDLYGYELAGRSASELNLGTASPNLGVYIMSMDVPTTNGYTVNAEWYIDTNTVQFIYVGEILPGGVWYSPHPDFYDFCDYIDEHYDVPSDEGFGVLDVSHEDRVNFIGEPVMTEEEVIQACSRGKADYVKRIVINTTKKYKIQAFGNLNDNTVEYVYPGDVSPYGSRASFVDSADALAIQGKYSASREEKVEILGEPEMTEEEVMAAIREEYGIE